jgi:hypothetical protein
MNMQIKNIVSENTIEKETMINSKPQHTPIVLAI